MFSNALPVVTTVERAQYDKHYVPSWTYNIEKGAPGKTTKSMDDAVADLNKVLKEYPRVEVITNEAVSSEAGKGHYSTFSSPSTLLSLSYKAYVHEHTRF